MKWSHSKRYGYVYMTGLLFLISVVLHWVFAWSAYKNEQLDKGKTPETKEYVIETMRDTMENWQSEFLQLIWQVAGLSFLYFIASPQSKEGDERKEEKIDYIIRSLDPNKGEDAIKKFNSKFPRK